MICKYCGSNTKKKNTKEKGKREITCKRCKSKFYKEPMVMFASDTNNDVDENIFETSIYSRSIGKEIKVNDLFKFVFLKMWEDADVMNKESLASHYRCVATSDLYLYFIERGIIKGEIYTDAGISVPNAECDRADKIIESLIKKYFKVLTK